MFFEYFLHVLVDFWTWVPGGEKIYQMLHLLKNIDLRSVAIYYWEYSTILILIRTTCQKIPAVEEKNRKWTKISEVSTLFFFIKFFIISYLMLITTSLNFLRDDGWYSLSGDHTKICKRILQSLVWRDGLKRWGAIFENSLFLKVRFVATNSSWHLLLFQHEGFWYLEPRRWLRTKIRTVFVVDVLQKIYFFFHV